MTILPKKKQTKEKNESEKSSDSHSVGHSTTSDPSRGARRTNSPPRWIPQNSLEDRLPSHDVGSRRFQDEFGSHDGGANHNKRRHRSSPHRSIRKHRHERPPAGTGRSSPPSQAPRSSVSPPPTPSPTEGDSMAMEEEMNTGYNSEDEYGEARNDDDELERWFEDTLRRRGLMIKRMGEDGACLFRAVADQVFGDQEMHSIVRRSCVDYMAKNADFFKQYVTEEFSSYLRRKRIENCHGNHLEMQAMSELYNRPIEVYQYGPEPINTFHGQYKTDNDPIRLSYHKNIHYNSIVDPYKATIGVGLGLPGYEPGAADRNLMTTAMKASEETHIEKTMLEDKMRETDWELTQETLEEQVARESYLQWLRDNEKRASRQSLTRTASATCSSARESTSRSSPRTRSANNSGPNSPNRTDSSEIPLATSMELQQPATPPPGPSCDRCPTPEGAVGGAGVQIPETSSLMNDLYCLPDWDEQDILAQVIAQSQQEYLDKLKKQSTSLDPLQLEEQTPSTSTSDCCDSKTMCQASTSSAAPSCSGTPFSSSCNENMSGNS